MKATIALLFGAVLTVLCTSHPVSAGQKFDPSIVPWNSFADDFVFGESEFKGTWKDSQRWRGTLCNGHYVYDTEVKGHIEDVIFDLRPDQSVSVYGDLRSLSAYAEGEYRSKATLCTTVWGGHSVRAGRGEIFATVTFIDIPGDPIPRAKVQIESTRVYDLRLVQGAPAFLNDFLNDLVNRALAKVWGSFLGNWINEKISDALKKPRKLNVERPNSYLVNG